MIRYELALRSDAEGPSSDTRTFLERCRRRFALLAKLAERDARTQRSWAVLALKQTGLTVNYMKYRSAMYASEAEAKKWCSRVQASDDMLALLNEQEVTG